MARHVVFEFVEGEVAARELFGEEDDLARVHREVLDDVEGGDERIRIGTVDKFQGQQAAVVFYSMASSSSDDVPRGLDFLFSRNRLNVAISRAQCLAVLVHSKLFVRVDEGWTDNARQLRELGYGEE